MNNIIRVLLIEDNSGYADLIEELLKTPHRQKVYFNIDHVDRLQTALELLTHTRRFEVILSDLDLPDSRGSETIELLTGHNCTPPIVVLTGNDDKNIERECKRAGVQGYLNKKQVTGQLLANTLIYAIIWQRAQE